MPGNVVLGPNSSSLFMETYWFIIVAVFIAAGSIAIGVTRNRRFRAIELRHSKLAGSLGLEVAFADPRQYAIFGSLRGYPIRIEPVNLAEPGSKQPAWHTKIHLQVQNPLRKMIRIARRSPHAHLLDRIVPLNRLDSLAHDLDPWMNLQTNDMMFASILLSDEVKISIHLAFRNTDAAILYIEDDELAWVMPGLLLDDTASQLLALAADLLCDMKDELKQPS